MFSDIVNSRINWHIRLTPIDVANTDFMTAIKKRIKLQNNKKSKFQQVGDKVRLALAENKFQKGYKPHNRLKIFLVKKHLSALPNIFCS